MIVGLNVPVSMKCKTDKPERHKDGSSHHHPMGVFPIEKQVEHIGHCPLSRYSPVAFSPAGALAPSTSSAKLLPLFGDLEPVRLICRGAGLQRTLTAIIGILAVSLGRIIHHSAPFRVVFFRMMFSLLARDRTATAVRFSCLPITRASTPLSANDRRISSSAGVHRLVGTVRLQSFCFTPSA